MGVVQDLVMNVDLTDMQYNIDKLVASAELVGFDMQELEELGFDLKGDRCGYKMCFDTEQIKSFDDFN